MRTLLVVFCLVAGFSVAAQKAEIFTKGGKAIRGYDPVAYFTQGRPVKGAEAIQYSWRGSTWLFSSKNNRDAFAANPEKYAPQYGGYCAYGLSKGYKASTEPDAWSVVNGRLYLNYDLDVRDEWNKNRDERIKNADKFWPAVKNKE